MFGTCTENQSQYAVILDARMPLSSSPTETFSFQADCSPGLPSSTTNEARVMAARAEANATESQTGSQ